MNEKESDSHCLQKPFDDQKMRERGSRGSEKMKMTKKRGKEWIKKNKRKEESEER